MHVCIRRSRGFYIGLAILGLSFFVLPWIDSSVRGQGIAAQSNSSANQWVEVPITISNVSYVFVEATINDRKLRLMIDTGSPTSDLDSERIKDLKLDWKKIDGVEKPQNVFVEWDPSRRVSITDLRIGGRKIGQYSACACDCSKVNSSLAAYNEQPIDGIFGHDLLISCGAVIDYNRKILRFRESETDDIIMRRRDFRVPFSFRENEESQIKRARVFVSEDRGKTWAHYKDVLPDAGGVEYQAVRDGACSFAVQWVMKDGTSRPPNEKELKPSLHVFIQTRPIALETTTPLTDIRKEVEELKKEIERLKKSK